jgi:drug/metabolite transporter (DMT)-like permease
VAFFFLSLSILGSTIMWPLNRWLSRRGGDTTVYGLWIGATGTVLAGIMALALGEDLGDPLTWLIGAVIAAAFSFGYCFALMQCIRTGPIGPSAAVNNMGLLWPVVLGAAWMNPHPLRPWHWAGLALTVAALVLFGLGKTGNAGTSGNDAPRGVSLRWGFWAILTWISAGVSMTAQNYASLHVPRRPFALLFSFMGITTVVFIIVTAVGRRKVFSRTEMAAGAGNGALQVMSISAMFLALQTLNAELVFPFSIGTPVILALFLGAVVYRDRIERTGIIATVLGIAGLAALSLA